ncbi:von Willebrand factor C domain-containing protein 2-like [Crassostrea virginica]
MASLTLQIFCLIATGLLTVHGLTPLLATTPGGCLYHGQYYPVGSFQASPCEPCQCTSSGQAFCAIVDCFFGGCVDQVHDKNHCCPVCPNGRNCKAPDGTIIKHGDTYSTGDMTCHCSAFGILAECTYKLQPISVDPLPVVS